MKGNAMKSLCSKLISDGHDLGAFDALEFFAREGDWQTIVYAKLVSTLQAWEIDCNFESGLRRNLPSANVKIVDSYAYGKECSDRFDFIVLDNPQATFGADGEYCEHFEALPVALELLKPSAFLVFNINWAPFNFEQHHEWKKRRSRFYGIDDTSYLSVDDFVMPFYKKYFESRGYRVLSAFAQPRNDEYLSYVIFHLQHS